MSLKVKSNKRELQSFGTAGFTDRVFGKLKKQPEHLWLDNIRDYRVVKYVLFATKHQRSERLI